MVSSRAFLLLALFTVSSTLAAHTPISVHHHAPRGLVKRARCKAGSNPSGGSSSSTPAASTPAKTTPAAAAPSNNNSNNNNNNNNNSGGDSSKDIKPAPQVGSLTPNGNKAGISGGDSYNFLQNKIGWWNDWSPNPSKPGKPIGVPMLWGGGTADSQDASRLSQFKQITNAPPYVLGFEEPDCASGSGSAGMSVDDGLSLWNSLIVPLRNKGSKVASPAMCKQADETWLKQFKAKGADWDITSIHINKNNMDGVRKDIDYYWNTYGKPIWVHEFACVNDVNGFVPCTDQGQINQYINDIVDLMENDSRVHAYAYSEGLGLSSQWALTNGNGASLSASGQTYLAAISKYH